MTTKYSDDDTYFSFLDYDSFVTELGLKEDRDDRGLVRNLIERANRRVTLELKPYIGEYDFTDLAYIVMPLMLRIHTLEPV